MRIRNIFILLAMAVCVDAAAAGTKIAGTKISSCRIVYSAAAEDEEGIEMAVKYQALIREATSLKAETASDQAAGRYKGISIINSGELGVFEYDARVSSGRLIIDAGGSWAMLKAGRLIAEQLAKGNISSSFRLHGTVEGEYLFPRAEGSDLRILDDNIWDYSKETVPDAWQALGVDCRDSVRAPQFAQLVRAYMPDVVTLQEYNVHMHRIFYPLIRKYGYEISYESGKHWNNTPIFYNKETVELVSVHFNLYSPSQWSNHGSKSFTSAVLRQKATGKLFTVITTHLWWKSETAQPGSNHARAAQVHLMMAESDILRARHGDAPVVITGDMNTYEDSLPIQEFIKCGYVPCYKVATVYGDTHNGHHICSPKDGFSRTSRRRSPERENGAIDHCLIYGNSPAEVKVFDCIMAAFTVKLTDHYPNIIDIKLK